MNHKFHTGFSEGCRQVVSDTRSKFFIVSGPTIGEHERFMAAAKGCDPAQKLHRFASLERTCVCGEQSVVPPAPKTSAVYKRALKQYVLTGER